MRKLICWLFGHLIRRSDFEGAHGTWNQATKQYDWPDGYECPRCKGRAHVGRFV